MSFRNAKTLLLVCSTLFALAALPMSGLAQYSSPGGGVDDSNAVFQLEGNTTTDPYICFGINTAGPVIATPGTSKSCPSGTNLVQFGTQTEDWANISSNTTVSAASTGIGSDLFNSLNDD